MSSREFAEWMAYDLIEPFGELRNDVRSALITQACRIQYSSQPVKLKDCMALEVFGVGEKTHKNHSDVMASFAQAWQMKEQRERKKA